MTTPAPTEAPKKLDGNEKLAVEMGPLLLLFAGLFLHKRIAPFIDTLFQTDYFNRPGRELYLALALFCPAFAVAFAYSVWKTRRVAPMLMVTAVITVVMAALTFLFDNKQFFYMKPTLIYSFMAAILGGGLLVGQNFLKVVFDGAFEMPEKAWRILTWRFVAFSLLAATANEIAWRSLTAECVPDMACAGEKTWVAIKVFGFTAAYIGFVIANMPFIMKQAASLSPPDTSENKGSDEGAV